MNDVRDREQEALVAALAQAWERAGTSVKRYETHISRVLVAGGSAYKFKKPLRLPFLDFESLAAREFYCREELRLNQRLAPDLYLAVVPVRGPRDAPTLGGTGEVCDYVVVMKAFSQDALWSEKAASGTLSAGEIDALAARLAGFHLAAPAAGPADAPGTPVKIRAIAADNEDYLRRHLDSGDALAILERLRPSSSLDEQLTLRKLCGHIRECHGDLHLRNILTEDGKVQVFDCLEFNEDMRWIDVMNDIAFVCMDLRYHGRNGLASRFLNAYLERTGDYAGLAVFGHYFSQRALVRAKICLMEGEEGLRERREAQTEAARYVRVAAARENDAPPAIVLMHGYSGSGKSTLAAQVAGRIGAIIVRSDAERKRLHGIARTARKDDGPDEGIYRADATRRTYERLAQAARDITGAGCCAIIDAAFLEHEQRKRFEELAGTLGLPLLILDVQARPETMRARLESRRQKDDDPSDAGPETLMRQLERAHALLPAELSRTLQVDRDAPLNEAALAALCGAVRERLAASLPPA